VTSISENGRKVLLLGEEVPKKTASSRRKSQAFPHTKLYQSSLKRQLLKRDRRWTLTLRKSAPEISSTNDA